MAKVNDIKRNLNKQLKATNGVVSSVSLFINDIKQDVDTVIIFLEEKYLASFVKIKKFAEDQLNSLIRDKIEQNEAAAAGTSIRVRNTRWISNYEEGITNTQKINEEILNDPDYSPRQKQLSTQLAELRINLYKKQITRLQQELASAEATGTADDPQEPVILDTKTFDAAIDQISGLINGVIDPINDQVSNILNTVKGTINGLLDTVSGTITALSKILTQDGPGMVDKIGTQVVASKAASLPAGDGILGKIQDLGSGGIFPNLSFLDAIKSGVTNGISSLTSGITTLLGNVVSTITSILGADEALDGIQNIIDKITKKADQFKKDAENNFVKQVNTDTGALENMKSISVSNTYEGTNFDNLNNAKVSLDSLNKTKAVVGTIHREFKDYTTTTIKSWIKLLRHIHPEIDKELDGLLYFKPISDDIASRTLGYYPDTQSLDLEDWDKEYAAAIRLNTQYKIPQDDLDNINDSYLELNKAMVRNISTEFTKERALRPSTGNIKADSLSGRAAHDYHIAGDSSYVEHMRKPLVLLGVNALLLATFQDSLRLISYLTPISNYGKAIAGPIEIDIKGETYSVNMKNVPYQKPINKVDNTVLKPINED